ncbi:MAG: restriction endonuclease subunit R [Leptolyngbyaceae cyanobacterium RU_5_1]|nr:restriction endonuclease subunit R [Leptolyngbyaceae cyanobacterium RU_5_1]
MTQTLLARNVNIRDLIDQFGLQLVRDRQFFMEWQEDLPELTESEKQFLDKVREGFFNLMQYPPYLEKSVQISILSPLLFLADFFLPPFHIKAEQSTEIVSEDEGVVVRGQLDLIVLKERFWVLVIESKEFSYSPEAGLAQLLAYMLANPETEKPCFGLLTNGSDFRFLKLLKNPPQYSVSNQFNLLNQGNELYPVLQIMKRLGQL